MKIRRTLSATGIAVAALAMTITPPASAVNQDDRPPTADMSLNDLAAANPGAKRLSADTIELANGVQVTARPAGYVCGPGHLCIYDWYNGQGKPWDFYKCGFVNIGASGWSDRIKSYHNNQTNHAVSIFMDWRPSAGGWVEVERSAAPEYISHERGAGIADGLWVC